MRTQPGRPDPPENPEDRDAVREYGRQLAIDALIRDAVATGKAPRKKAKEVPDQKAGRCIPMIWVATAACLILVAVAIWIFKSGKENPLAVHSEPTEPWTIKPGEGAEYTIVDRNLIRVLKGELRITSNEKLDSPFTVETPNTIITTTANDADFFIGHHLITDRQNQINPKETMNTKGITRAFVLAGMLTVSTEGGSITAGEKEALIVADPDKTPEKITVAANSKFALNLYQQLSKEKPGESLLFSPYSISSALAMTAEGAREKTAEEMGQVLGLPDQLRRIGDDAQKIPWEISKLHLGLGSLNEQLNQKDKPYTLSVANAIWGEKTYPFSKKYVETLDESYSVNALQVADFLGNSNAERIRINSWAAEKTRDRIQNLFPEGSIDSDTRLVLANAIYFKGDWEHQFKPNLTRDAEFLLNDGGKIKTKMMHHFGLEDAKYGAFYKDGSHFDSPEMIDRRKEQKLYPGDDGFAIAELPYKGKQLSMVVISPNDPTGLGAIESMVNSDNLSVWMSSLKERKIHLALPRFRSESSFPMNDTLAGLGMPTAFTERANFNGMREGESNAGLYIQFVIHKAFIEVNEEGTEAAAATGVAVGGVSAPVVEPFTPYFRADRPFIYLIKDNSSGSILFLGRMMNPSA